MVCADVVCVDRVLMCAGRCRCADVVCADRVLMCAGRVLIDVCADRMLAVRWPCAVALHTNGCLRRCAAA